MTTDLNAYWWSPRRSPRVLAAEVRAHGSAWLRLLNPPSRAFTNYGDELTGLVLSETFGRSVRWAPLGREDVAAIGSILVPYFANGGRGLIWGSGLNQPIVTPDRAARVRERFLAVRGPRTRAALGLDGAVQLGDPGLVVRTLRPRSPRRSGKVLIPHFTVYRTAQGRRKISELVAAGYRVAEPTLDPAVMIDTIGSAESVVSSGMHGVILSHSLGTPASLISFADEVPAEPAFKYLDYHDSVGLDARISSWSDFLDDSRAAAEIDRARQDIELVSPTIDSLVEGLLAAARPLRTAG